MRLIDADKLLEKNECLFKDLNSTEDYMGIGYNHGVGDSIAIIKNAPTIEAEPVRRGRWEIHEDDSWSGGGFTKCLACGYGFAWGAFFEAEEWGFCPICGASMDLKGEPHDQN